jgi:hypothetical protein
MPPLAALLPAVEDNDSCCLDDGSWVSAASTWNNEVTNSRPCSTITRSVAPAPKKVRFSPSAEVHQVPNLNDFSEEEINAMWLTVEECQQLRENCIQLLKRIKHKNRSKFTSQQDKDDDCIRGLEGKRCSKIAKIRKQAKQAAKMVVFKWQEEQHNYQNVEEIASIYQAACRYAMVQAIQSAQQDEKNVYPQLAAKSRKRNTLRGMKTQSLFRMFRTSVLVSHQS